MWYTKLCIGSTDLLTIKMSIIGKKEVEWTESKHTMIFLTLTKLGFFFNLLHNKILAAIEKIFHGGKHSNLYLKFMLLKNAMALKSFAWQLVNERFNVAIKSWRHAFNAFVTFSYDANEKA